MTPARTKFDTVSGIRSDLLAALTAFVNLMLAGRCSDVNVNVFSGSVSTQLKCDVELCINFEIIQKCAKYYECRSSLFKMYTT